MKYICPVCGSDKIIHIDDPKNPQLKCISCGFDSKLLSPEMRLELEDYSIGDNDVSGQAVVIHEVSEQCSNPMGHIFAILQSFQYATDLFDIIDDTECLQKVFQQIIDMYCEHYGIEIDKNDGE